MAAIDTADIIALCNVSLSLLGATRIALSTTSVNHTYCNSFYAKCRDEMLVAHKWNFAKKRTYAIQTTDPIFGYDNAFTKPTDCLKVWMIDEDALAKFEVEGGLILTDLGEKPPAWATATAYIVGQPVTNDDNTYTCLVAHTSGALDDEPGTGALTATYWTDNGDDYQVLSVEYVYQATDVGSYPVYLYQCVVYNLALKLAAPIKQDERAALNLQQMLHGGPKVLGYLAYARSIDAQEQGGVTIKTTKFLDARR